MGKKIEIFVYNNWCVYINDRRVAGNKPYVSMNLKGFGLDAKVEDILDSLDIKDVEEYINKKRGKK